MMHSDTEVRDNEGHMVGSCKTLRDNGKLSTASAFLPPPGRLRLLSYLAVGVLWPAKSRHELRIAHGKAIESSERKARKASFLTDLSYWCIHLCLEHIVQISNTGFPASSAVDWRPCKRRDSFMVHEANLGKGSSTKGPEEIMIRCSTLLRSSESSAKSVKLRRKHVFLSISKNPSCSFPISINNPSIKSILWLSC